MDTKATMPDIPRAPISNPVVPPPVPQKSLRI